MTNYAQHTGTTRAVESVDLRARIRGFLKEQKFRDGAEVKEGDLLLVIDEEPFQVQVAVATARVDEAKAALLTAEQSKSPEVATAQLALDDALLMLAQGRRRPASAACSPATPPPRGPRPNPGRAQAHGRPGGCRQGQTPTSQGRLRHTRSAAAKANLEAANADLRNAEINLSYCRIQAPISGRISRRLVDVGNLVGDGEATLLATILKEDPIYAYMSISRVRCARLPVPGPPG